VSDSINEPTDTTPDLPGDTPATPEGTQSGPIDVNELLQSTRQLFEQEEIDRAMEVAGYEPPRGDRGPVEGADESTPVPDVDTPDVSEQVSHDEAENREELSDSASVDTGFVDTASDNTASEDSEEGIDSDVEKTSRKHRGLNVLAVVSLVLAIALSPLAILFGYIALGQSRRAGQRGEQLALWAIGVGWLVLAGWAIVLGSLVWIGVERGITLESLSEFLEFFSVP
jgi:hypothetical protein